jgi:hypothetical protein
MFLLGQRVFQHSSGLKARSMPLAESPETRRQKLFPELSLIVAKTLRAVSTQAPARSA